MTAERIRELLQARERKTLDLEGARRAAVLVPLVERDGALHVVFTERSEGLREHSGQVSFPGGKLEPGETDPVAAALRETEEELGIAPASVDVLGLMDDVFTITNYTVTPVVARLTAPPETYAVNAAEVAEVFEVPIDRLADPTIFHIVGEVERQGKMRKILAYKPDGRNIWGATARMVHAFLELVRQPR